MRCKDCKHSQSTLFKTKDGGMVICCTLTRRLGKAETDHDCPCFNADLSPCALETFPSAQTEQTDCEYCHEDSDGNVRSIEKNSHAWLVRRGRTMKLRVGFKGGYSECDILFCPMCGRRLTNG